MATFSKTGKPLCCSHRNGRKCQRLGKWFFPYRSMGQSVKSYFCEVCAAEKGYQVFHQPLIQEG